MAAIIARITNNTGYLVEHQHDVPRNAVWIVNPTDIENDKINHIEACTSDSGKPLVVNRGTRTLTYDSDRFKEQGRCSIQFPRRNKDIY